MPWRAVAEVAGFWPFGSFCDVWVAFDIMCSTASILNLCIISVDRYWAIASPFRYERKMTRRVALIMIGVAWTLSVLISFIPVQLSWHKAQRNHPQPESMGTSGKCDASLNRTYAITSSLISFYIPVAIMIVTYTRIFRIAQRQIRRISMQERAAKHVRSCQGCSQLPEDGLKSSFKKETKVLKTLSIIMGVFVCCWLPFFVLNCMVPFCNPGIHGAGQLPCVSETTFDVFVWFGWANSTLNPVVYAFNADFRRAFAVLLGCGRLCSNNTVETVDFSNELVSYHHDTTNPQDLRTYSYPYLLPHAIREPGDKELSFDIVSHITEATSRDKCSYPDTHHLPVLVHGEGEMDLSLDKITPFTQEETPSSLAHNIHIQDVTSVVTGIL
ncbi:dopamine receptor D7 [Megalops cyprinoides]|uniref:dopamine receptor D7 n=1 Tax=Megalops cyprinoides TaxID=118141 RepID=UPI001863AC1E|nr:dopamine receptor D7 [Megalops cyprinoides]